MVNSSPRKFPVTLRELDDSFTAVAVHESQTLSAWLESGSFLVIQADETEVSRHLAKNLDCVQVSGSVVCIRPADSEKSLLVKFTSADDSKAFLASLKHLKHSQSAKSVFDVRTEEASAAQYFQFYGYLSQQQNMMQDYVRTSTYQHAMLSNLPDFENKVVLDVGAGSGILSFFAIQAGAKKVYAVEASSMAQHCQSLVKHNNLSDQISVICGKIEDISLPEQVDTIISEPMGYMLVNERMLETFLHAKKFLKPGGRMFPSRGDLHIAPFSDEALYLEQCSKANFWCQDQFHGVNLSCLREQALQEYLRQPIVDCFDISICLAKSIVHQIDFQTSAEEDLFTIDIPLNFQLHQTALVHGLAFWFDCAFIGASQTTWLSTAPTEPLTHWYQVRCLLATPVLGKVGDRFTGRLILKANTRQSYDVEIELTSNGVTSKNCHDLKNPLFRYTGQPAAAAANQHSTVSPTDQYWNQWLMNTAGGDGTNGAGNAGVDGVAQMNGGGAYNAAAVAGANQLGANYNYGGHTYTTHMNYGVRSSIRQGTASPSAHYGQLDAQLQQQQQHQHFNVGQFVGLPPTASHEMAQDGAGGIAGELLMTNGAGELVPAVHNRHSQNQQLQQHQSTFGLSAAQFQQQQQQLLLLQQQQQQLMFGNSNNVGSHLRPLFPTSASDAISSGNITKIRINNDTSMVDHDGNPDARDSADGRLRDHSPRLADENDITRTVASLAGVSFATTTTDSGLNSVKTVLTPAAGPQLSCRSGVKGGGGNVKGSSSEATVSAQDMVMEG